ADYGVLGYTVGDAVDFDSVKDIEEQYEVEGGTQTPQTGLFDSTLKYLIILPGFIVIMGVISILKMTKKSKRGNMKDSIR
ncbi:MAG TPA: hypothetical protein P5311_00585, partial [Candidatus Dojkabacteria bacterium]|nr:hypothetical protein [Candidatus Dojkabacteria bacterium]